MTPEELVDRLESDERAMIENKPNGSPHALIGFPNGWGASVIWDGYGGGNGRMELAVTAGFDGDLCYTTPITDDVLGYLDDEMLMAAIADIRALDQRDPGQTPSGKEN